MKTVLFCAGLLVGCAGADGSPPEDAVGPRLVPTPEFICVDSVDGHKITYFCTGAASEDKAL
jgi:hypothetical protein